MPDTTSADHELSILLLCDDNATHANTIIDHIAALKQFSRHHIFIFNPRGVSRSRLLDLSEFDVVLIHYSLVINHDHYLSPYFREKVRRFTGLKIQMIQDDYRMVDDITAVMRQVGIQVLYTLVPEGEIPKIWTESRLPGVKKITTLAGFVPEYLVNRATPDMADRPIDIGYRGRILPYWLGRLGQEKVWIAQGILGRASKYGLRCDIGWREGDRIYGESWIQFLSSCKATLGTESGATITDFDGSIERRVREYLVAHPGATFEEVSERILSPHEGNVRMNVISPRIFEAAALRTALILFEGEYSGILKPDIHYIPLRKDFSNLDVVVEKLRDLNYLRELVRRSYEDLCLSGKYSYRSFVEGFDKTVSSLGQRMGRQKKIHFRLAQLERAIGSPYQWCLMGLHKTRTTQRAKQLIEIILAIRLVLHDQELLRFFEKWITHGQGIARRSLFPDLLRLALVRRARTGTVLAGQRFRVDHHIDPTSGTLIIKSEPSATPKSEHPGGRSEVPVSTFCWDHSSVGQFAYYPLSATLCFPIRLGEHGLYQFKSLSRLAKNWPLTIWTLATSACGDSDLAWLGTLERTLIILNLIFRFKPNRILFRRFLGSSSLRSISGLKSLLREILRLRTMRTLVQGDSPATHVKMEFHASEGTLWLNSLNGKSESLSDLIALEPGRIRRVLWNHSVHGPYLIVRGVSIRPIHVALEPSGVFEFTTLSALARVYPKETLEALEFASGISGAGKSEFTAA
jgi:hypothetical protein